MKPEVSVIIPSLGRETVLADTIRELLSQELTNWECLVVLQGERTSDRPVDEIAETDGRIRIFILQEPNASLARNVGLVEARADIVLFLDDDVRFRDAGFLRAHVRHYDVASASGVAGQIVAPEGEVRFRRHARSQRTDTGWLYTPANFAFPLKTRSGVSANLSVRRAWAIEAGGMDARFEKGAHREESDFCIRYTERFGLLDFDPAAGLVHLQVDSGGCRTWGHNAGVHPPHHVQGEWYFILKGLTRGYIRTRHLPDHLFLLMLRQILNRENRRSPRKLARASWRSMRGLVKAWHALRQGPREVDMLDRTSYVALGDRGQALAAKSVDGAAKSASEGRGS